jgi:hypothetical protein
MVIDKGKDMDFVSGITECAVILPKDVKVINYALYAPPIFYFCKLLAQT